MKLIITFLISASLLACASKPSLKNIPYQSIEGTPAERHLLNLYPSTKKISRRLADALKNSGSTATVSVVPDKTHATVNREWKDNGDGPTEHLAK